MNNATSTDYAWFSSLIFCEILFELPFLFVAIKFIMAGGRENTSDSSEPRKQLHYPEWFRMACIVDSTHVSTTLVPIIGAFVISREMTMQQKCTTIASKCRNTRNDATALHSKSKSDCIIFDGF
jgi:hypothetical protein